MREDFVTNTSLPEDEFEAQIVSALERRPAVLMDDGLAARVMARVPRVVITARRPATSRRVGLVAALVLLIVITVLAPATSVRSIQALGLEYSLMAEFLAVAVWLGLTPRTR